MLEFTKVSLQHLTLTGPQKQKSSDIRSPFSLMIGSLPYLVWWDLDLLRMIWTGLQKQNSSGAILSEKKVSISLGLGQLKHKWVNVLLLFMQRNSHSLLIRDPLNSCTWSVLVSRYLLCLCFPYLPGFLKNAKHCSGFLPFWK